MTLLRASRVFALGLFPLAVVASDGSPPFAAETFQWKQRLLLVFAPGPEHPAVGEQMALWKDAGPEASERNLLTFLWKGAAELPAAAKQKYDIDPDKFTVLLIGKDGGVKLRSYEPAGPDRIFALIDSMPMRRDEMRKAAAK